MQYLQNFTASYRIPRHSMMFQRVFSSVPRRTLIAFAGSSALFSTWHISACAKADSQTHTPAVKSSTASDTPATSSTSGLLSRLLGQQLPGSVALVAASMRELGSALEVGAWDAESISTLVTALTVRA